MSVKSSALAVVVITALFCFANFPLVQASVPTAKIVSVDYPKHVLPGTVFHIGIVADYSEKSGVDVGIWDADSGVVIDSIAIPLAEAGRASFTLKLTAPLAEADWHLTAITRIWWQSAWYQDPDGGSVRFTISVSDAVIIALSSEGAASQISVDGVQHQAYENKPTILQVKRGVHRLEALSAIQAEPMKRLVFVGWSDGVNSNPRELLFAEDTNITSIYRTEYYLSLKSAVGRVSGEGWYEQGSQATIAITPTSFSVVAWLGVLFTQFRFDGWSGDTNSTDNVATIAMNQPKNIEAKWVYSGTTTNPFVVSVVFFAGALVLAVRTLYTYSRHRHSGLRISIRLGKHSTNLVILAAVLLTTLILVPPSHAQLLEQPTRSIVHIGDASWYYWEHERSDTCLLWLGGGISQDVGQGYDSYWVNPFDYESFGTIRFMQDLAKYYCVIALQRGSYERMSADSNRTIYQEPYQLQSTILTQVRDWIRTQGYAHSYLVGYSTGAEVAAMEVTMQAPDEWTSPDGLILITPRLSDSEIKSAYRTRANLLVLYGSSIETPEYVATGTQFYNNTPNEGWHGSHYLHKEFHVIAKMGHEVWTVLETGTYDTQALHITVNFVEKSKVLQFRPEETASFISGAEKSSLQNSTIKLTSLSAPRRISPNQILVIEVDLSNSGQTKTSVRTIAADIQSARIVSAADLTLDEEETLAVNLLVSPPYNSAELRLEIIIMQNLGQGWVLAERPQFTTTTIANTLTVTLETTVPNISLMFDDVPNAISGETRVETRPGTHTLQVQPVVYVNRLTRAIFTGWEDGTPTPTRQVTIDNDTTLVAFYRKQYFVNATSSYGHAEGSGWYDENSTATILLQPPVVGEAGVVFSHWAGDSTDSHPRTLLLVNSPKAIQARWDTIGELNESNSPNVFVIICLSVIIFAILLILNLRRTKR